MQVIVRRSLSILFLSLAACWPARNYPDPASPRVAGVGPNGIRAARGDTLRIVSFNIEYARRTRGAAHVLTTAAPLRDADIILLQEMTGRATRYLANELGMQYVYYPAIYNRILRQDVGNAILSRWPMSADSKLILPARSRYARTQRIATAATVEVGPVSLRVYSTHLGTPADVGWEGRVAQLGRIFEDAAAYPDVVIGGDMNSGEIGRVARDSGYVWPTDTVPRSSAFGRLDHFFLRGAIAAKLVGAGTQRVARSVSDHHPIWMRLLIADLRRQPNKGSN